MTALREVVCLALTLYVVVLIARIVLSWVPRLPEGLLPLARGVSKLTDPLLQPLRGLLPSLQLGGGIGLDLSPIILFLAIALVQNILC